MPQGKLPELGPADIGKRPDKESQKARLTPMTRKCLWQTEKKHEQVQNVDF